MKEPTLRDLEKSLDYIEYLLKNPGKVNLAPFVSVFAEISKDVKNLVKKEDPKFEVNFSKVEKLLSDIAKVLSKEKDTTTEEVLNKILIAIEKNAPEKIGEKIDAMDEVFRGLKPKDSVRFDDDQMKNLMAALTNQGPGIGGGSIAGLADEDGNVISPATNDKIPSNDLYITYNGDGTINTKVWKRAGTSTVIKTLTYNYSGGALISKILS